jgi:hypothetical protein
MLIELKFFKDIDGDDNWGSLAQCFTSRVTPAKRSIRFLTHRSSPAIACYFAKHLAETVAFRRLAIFAFRHF